MKNIKKISEENPNTTILTILSVLVAVGDLVVSMSESLELPENTVAWVGFGIASIGIIRATILNNRSI